MLQGYEWVWIIPILPLIAAIGGTIVLKRWSLVASFNIVSIGISALLSLFLLYQKPTPFILSYHWFHIFNFSLLIDRISIFMLVLVSCISFLIQVYSLGYMKEDASKGRYFIYMSLFTFSMLGLVTAGNFILIYLFWELVGLCSYLLIGFWYERKAAAAAAKKAFITTRIGDFFFLIGIIYLAIHVGSVEYSVILETPEALGLKKEELFLVAILIFCGAIGKSAQLPLHVWLPDAMEGPTPVSALIHAATMVAAGVYLVARCFPLFSVVSTPLQIVGYIGGITALFAAICALSESDLKRILAYSTISQLGYMFAGLYVAIFSPQIGLFHLMTHGVFKALLFLCAGCVIHKLHLQNIWALGGLWRNMPKVALAFAIGAAALAGLPFTSGYYSKELLLINAYYTDKIIFSILLLTAAFTAFYIARAFFLVFLGTPKHNVEVGSHHNKREIEWVMLIPVIILTLGAILVGYLPFLDFIGYSHTPHMNIIHPPIWVEILPTILSLMSIFLAFIIYRRLNFDKLRVMIRKIPGIVNIYKISAHKFFFDELYSIALVRSAKIIARTSDKFDTLVVDGGINSTAYIFSILGKLSRKLQLGFAQSYLFFAVISFSILLLIWLIYFLF